MKQLPDLLSSESFRAESELAVRILVHTKSIPEKVRVTHVSSAFQAGPSLATDSSYEAKIVNSMQATDHAGRAAVLGRALKRTTKGAKHYLVFFGHDPPGRTRRPVHLIFEAAAPQAEKVNSRGGLTVAGFESPLCSVAI
jgi:hypothetical protein